MRFVNFPKVKIERLADVQRFYYALPDMPNEIDVRTVVINNRRANEILDRLYKNAKTVDQQASVGMFWALCGPSSSNKVPYNKVGIREVDEL